VEPDDLPGLTHALLTLLSDDSLRKKMGDRALRITIPYFTWNRMVRLFFDRFGMPLE
jgi:glycosyltransferase involved in cell wall biosynthesis